MRLCKIKNKIEYNHRCGIELLIVGRKNNVCMGNQSMISGKT